MRISGVELPGKKRIVIALRYIYGIGATLAERVCREANVDFNIRTKDLKDEEGSRIQKIIEASFVVEEELKRDLIENFRRKISMKLKSAVRRMKGLACNGQRTKTNNKTAKKLGGIR